MSAEPLTSDDVYTLMGYAVFLSGQSKTDMPAYFKKLATKIAATLDDELLLKRSEQLSLIPETKKHIPKLANAL